MSVLQIDDIDIMDPRPWLDIYKKTTIGIKVKTADSTMPNYRRFSPYPRSQGRLGPATMIV